MTYVKAYGKDSLLPDYRFKQLARFVYSSKFEFFIAFIILINAISLALLTMPNLPESTQSTLSTIDSAAVYIYGIELTLRLVSYGKKPWKFFNQGWNVFDFIVVVLSFGLFSGQTIFLRLLRIFRLIRIFRFLPEVRILTSSVIKSIPPLISVGVLIFIALFIYGMAGVYLFGDDLPDAWGNITVAMTSLFILLTLENFPNYLEDAVAVSAWALPFYLSYIFVVVFTVLNVLIGIVLNAMDEARQEGKVESQDINSVDAPMSQLFDIVDNSNLDPTTEKSIKAKLNDIQNILMSERNH